MSPLAGAVNLVLQSAPAFFDRVHPDGEPGVDYSVRTAMPFPAAEQQISSRGIFTSVLRDLKRCIADGSLRQVKPADAPFALDDVTSVPDEGPWPDYVEAYFEDRSGQRYKLTVETYHGAGGLWERV